MDTERIYVSLGKLGGSADEIAGRLLALGYKGVGHSPYQFPVARYLREQFPEFGWAAGKQQLVARTGGCVERFDTPPEVAAFMRRFDSGRLPDLVGREGRRRLNRVFSTAPALVTSLRTHDSATWKDRTGEWP